MCEWERLEGFLCMAGEAAGPTGAQSLPEGCQGQSCSPLSWLSAQGSVSPRGNTLPTSSVTSRHSPREGWRETSPVRNTFSFALWKQSWDWWVIAVLGKVQLLSPSYHSRWLPLWCHCSMIPQVLKAQSSHPQSTGWCSHQCQWKIKWGFQMYH